MPYKPVLLFEAFTTLVWKAIAVVASGGGIGDGVVFKILAFEGVNSRMARRPVTFHGLDGVRHLVNRFRSSGSSLSR